MATESFDTVIVGGGQAGLATGYHLQRQRPVVRDPRRERARRRSVAEPLGLAPALLAGELRRASRAALPGEAHVVPDDARDGGLPRVVRGALRASGALGVAVDALTNGRCPLRASRVGDRRARGRQRRRRDGRDAEAATSRASRPSSIRGSHSSTRTTTGTSSQLQEGPVLVVGASHSGADIAYEARRGARHDPLRRRHRADPGEGRHASRAHGLPRAVLRRVKHILTMDTPMGRKMRPHIRHERRAAPAVPAEGPARRGRRADDSRGRSASETAGRCSTTAASSTSGTSSGAPASGATSRGSTCRSRSGDDGYPVQYRGVVESAPGLYFVGLLFLHSFTSMLIYGTGRGRRSGSRRTSRRRRRAARAERRARRAGSRAGRVVRNVRREAARAERRGPTRARSSSGTVS